MLLQITRWLILQQAQIQKLNFSYLACKLVISGSFSLPTTGSFHLSLTVLFSIGSSLLFCLTRRSSQIPTEFLVFHSPWDLDTLAFFIFYPRLSLSLVHFSNLGRASCLYRFCYFVY